MPDKHNYMKTRPFRSGSSRELARGGGQKIIFQNRAITKIQYQKQLQPILSKQEIWNR